MPTIRKKVTVPAGGAPVYPFQGDQFEYLPFDARVQIAIVQEELANTNVQATVYSGSDVLQQNGPITEKPSGSGANPTYPDDFLLDDEADAGDRLNCVLSNSGSVGATVNVVAVLTPR